MTKLADKTQVTDAQTRKTALLVGGVLLLLAAWNFHRGRMMTVIVFGGIGCALAFVGMLLPTLARRFHVLWMRIATALGYLNSHVLLSLMFYGVFTPYGIVSRLIGRDPLKRRDKGRDSYWIPRKNTRQQKEQFERLF